MKIIHVTPQYFGDDSLVGGGERYVDNLIQAVDVASTVDGQLVEQSVLAYGQQAGTLNKNNCRIDVLRNINPNTHSMAACGPEAWAVIQQADLVHVHQSLTYFGAYHSLIAKSLGKRLVLTDHGGGDNPLMLDYRGVQLADGLLCQSAFASSLLAPYYSGTRTVAIGPIDTSIFTPPAQGSVRAHNVLCVGRLLPHKGIDRIIKALPEGLRLVAVGRAYDSEYFALLQRLAEGKDVQFVTDATDADLLRIMRASGLLIHGSVYVDCYGNRHKKPELMGIAPLEAMACGLPVIVSDVASLPELASDSDYFRVYRNTTELEQLLIAFRDHVWPNKDIGQIAHDWIHDNYGLEVTGRHVLALYNSISKSNGDS